MAGGVLSVLCLTCVQLFSVSCVSGCAWCALGLKWVSVSVLCFWYLSMCWFLCGFPCTFFGGLTIVEGCLCVAWF